MSQRLSSIFTLLKSYKVTVGLISAGTFSIGTAAFSLKPTLVSASTIESFIPFSSIRPDQWMAKPVTGEKKLLKDNNYDAQMERLCMDMQSALCRALEKIDGKGTFFADKWERKLGGGGISCVMQDGKVFEKAGVNISVINGTLSNLAVKQMATRLKNIDPAKSYAFKACGISSVIHPRNPNVPTVHFNFRYFELDRGDGTFTWWYGGGSDLTPTYLEREDAVHFHKVLKDACDSCGHEYYPKYKKWCDDYFVIEHRGERRGVGGIFFDDLTTSNQEDAFKFVTACAEAIIPAYLPIVNRRKNNAYTYEDRQWQLLRRGRYVEFNLVYDRGTKFGLHTPEARIESILMSLPLYAKWSYNYDPSDDPRKMDLMKVLKNPEDWVATEDQATAKS